MISATRSLAVAAVLLGNVVNADADAHRRRTGRRLELMFDGKSLGGWRGYKTGTPSSGWMVSTVTSFDWAAAATS